MKAETVIRHIVIWALVWSASLCAAIETASPEVSLIPWPNELQVTEGRLTLTRDSRIVFETGQLRPLAEVLRQELYQVTGLRVAAVAGPARRGDIVLKINPELTGETHTVLVNDRVTLSGPNYKSTAMASASLLQAIQLHGEHVSLPRMTMTDAPHSTYRSLMVDLARQPHTIDTLKQCVMLCRLYKVSLLQLHLNDDQSFAFECKAFPKLATPGHHFTQKELKALVTFAEARGVTLVPELDAPGHTTAMRRAMPDLFGPPNLSVINLGKEDVFKAIETILSELCEIFHTSPYVHIGADEAYFTPLARDAQAKKAIEQKGYDNVHDLFYEYPPSRARSRAYSCACPMTLGAAGTGQNSASS